MATEEIIYGNTITLSNGNTLTIPHAHLEINPRNRVVLTMESGWVFYRTTMYPEGTPEEDICYFRSGVFGQTTDFSAFVVVDESTLDPDQIYSLPNPNPPVVTE